MVGVAGEEIGKGFPKPEGRCKNPSAARTNVFRKSRPLDLPITKTLLPNDNDKRSQPPRTKLRDREKCIELGVQVIQTSSLSSKGSCLGPWRSNSAKNRHPLARYVVDRLP